MAKESLVRNHPLNGLILLHPITDLEDSEQQYRRGMEKKRSRLLQSILGTDTYKRVVIANTMWGVFGNTWDAYVESQINFRRGHGVWHTFQKV